MYRRVSGGKWAGDAAGKIPQHPRCLPRHLPVLHRHCQCPLSHLVIALSVGVQLGVPPDWVAPLVAPAVDLSIPWLLLGARQLALYGAPQRNSARHGDW